MIEEVFGLAREINSEVDSDDVQELLDFHNQELTIEIEMYERCSDKWTEETSFTQQLDSGSPRQTSRREDHHIIRHARVEPTASLAAVQTQTAPLHYGPLCLSKPSQGARLKASGVSVPITRAADDTHPSTPPSGVVSHTTGLDSDGIEPGHLQRRI
ncbi:hypothetical protein TNCV_2032711 [Trichonephila clavipes]|nr:hypothetical protein TNCV_2032711 [Trichonephila clavipes]